MTSKRESGEVKRVAVFQHAQSENLGTIESALRAEAVEFEYIRLFQEQPIPKALEAFSALIVVGGPMGVYETDLYSFLLPEMKAIDHFLKERKPVLGICLGSQLLAACLGAGVRKGTKKEIGWYPVRLTDECRRDQLWKDAPEEFTAFHWHGDVFDLPSGSVSLASSQRTSVQGYRYDTHSYGLLFHLEVTESHVRNMLSEFAGEVQQEGSSAPAILEDARFLLPPLQRIGGGVFRGWAKCI